MPGTPSGKSWVDMYTPGWIYPPEGAYVHPRVDMFTPRVGVFTTGCICPPQSTPWRRPWPMGIYFFQKIELHGTKWLYDAANNLSEYRAKAVRFIVCTAIGHRLSGSYRR